MLKEKGYDEFLVEQIQKGEEAVAKGDILTKEQSMLEMQAMFAQLDRELALQEAELNEANYA
ncbi:hypothetical protein BMT54_02960 [Pasteurellaceae bacterium 15-036681]|nr:hypothetical protein BMT54_02960 [Pasteurellaceae bacterium 15-036681]